ncbi:hypothetical protein HPP92_023218 [Vanilla planifolia]|uniref:Acetyltransferase n=1 Tax=Vanilla planifolia TaxID=51239 RepID=A0A835PPY7_VANPL|nr:hypothetical protein HPP92_023218 [Vanilla planifolia]
MPPQSTRSGHALCSTHPKGTPFHQSPAFLSTCQILDHLKSTLSKALHHFYPLAGRMATEKIRNQDGEVVGLQVHIDCNDKGADFIHAVAENITAADVLSPGDDIPSFVTSFFPLHGAVGYDGHSTPFVSVQVTELADRAVFVACCFNHAVGDGSSYWHFFNSWAELARTNTLTRPPVHERWFIQGKTPPITLPFSDPSQFIYRHTPPPLRERFFHFSAGSVARLKLRANKEVGDGEATGVISSFQSLSALMWRAVTRARGFRGEQKTSCRLAIQNRGRLKPPQSPDYFGNSINVVMATATAGDLEAKGLGWAATKLNRAVTGYTDAVIREKMRAYHEVPMVYSLRMFDPESVMMGSSPRFDMYGCDFGWGKAAVVRTGTANKFDGKVSSFPGREGGGSVDLEVCLLPDFMAALLQDGEFMDAVSES